ncbi:MAG TPA: allantoinase AllB [Thermoanaerobaculia bacterium]|nr:allantoinase AllB [Thermoanaerobaculia bacterium]
MSQTLDLLIRGGEMVTPAGILPADVGIAEGRIAAIAPQLAEPAREVIDARGLHVFPGIVDAHVHFNEPGRADWEGLASGSAALAAAGGTCFFDMPLNSLPPVLDAASFEIKRAAAEHSSRLDFALWGGLTLGNLDHLGELAAAGAVGFKAFLCASGVPEFPAVTDAATLREGMKRAAALGLPVAVHAEDDALTRRLTEVARTRGETSARSWLATRPIEAELAAIRLAAELAGETGCALHVVHVSSPEGLAAIAGARGLGVDVTAETCPHYLLLDEEEVLRQGAPAKCAPPLRDEGRRRELWQALEAGAVDTIGSDHSPAPPAMKTASDFFEVWGGISGCQHGFPLLISESLERAPAAEALLRLASLLAASPARRFRLDGRKGRLAVGHDADLSLLDLGDEHVLANAELLYRHCQGPYEGRRCRVRVRRTLARGRTVFARGSTADPTATHAPWGRFLRPES